MSPNILEQAEADQIKTIREEKPSQFTIGSSWDGQHGLTGGITFDRTWKNGWGATAYARAWWNDTAVVPNAHKLDGAIGFEAVKRFD